MAKPSLVFPTGGMLKRATLRKEPINPDNFGFGLEDWVDVNEVISPTPSLFLSLFLGSSEVHYSQERKGGNPEKVPEEFRKSLVIGKFIGRLVKESRGLAEKFGAAYFTLVNVARSYPGYPMSAVSWDNYQFSLEPTSHLYVPK